MENIDPDDLPLSDDPEENLRMENEILRLKLKAELGAESHSMSNIPSEIENIFLKNVLNFEHAAAGAKQIKVYDLLKRPDFKPADEMNDKDLEFALKKITALMIKKNIAVDFSGTYDSRTKYKFITEELFEHETNDFLIPGMFMHFDYEEFHPNHKLDIEHRAIGFLSQWFDRSLDNLSWELSDSFVLPDRKILSRDQVAEKLKNTFDCYIAFTDYKYVIDDIHFELQKDFGMGHAEGKVKYTAVLENNEKIVLAGPFKLYLSFEHGWWAIVYFVFPGFEF